MKKLFNELGLSKEVLASIDKLGYVNPSPIQEEVIPLILEGNDIIGQAQTGTGKTLAFASGVLSKIDVKKSVVQCIVLTPTRELAIQVCDEFKSLNKSREFNLLAVYGGDSIERQIRALNKGVDIVVGTPGRVLDLMKRRKLSIKDIKFFVLDEADEMLNMGFLEDIEQVLEATNVEKQILMFSATMPRSIKKLATTYMNSDYKHVAIKSETTTSSNVEQGYYMVSEKNRVEILCRVLDFKESLKTIIFCQTKKECDTLVSELQHRGYSVEAMHGDISQTMRMQTLERFKKGSFQFLIATDVAARGIHVNNIELVINYRVPNELEAYVHRIGRTGRANTKGEAVTLISHKEKRFIRDVERVTKSTVIEKQVPTAEEIINSKYSSTLASLTEVENIDEALSYVRDLNKGDLITLAATLLKKSVSSTLGSNLDVDVTVKDTNSVRKVDPTKTRLFITIGKMDNLKQGSLIDFLKAETNIDKDHYKNIEILSTYTFIDIPNKEVTKFIDGLEGATFNGRSVRVEVSNKSGGKQKGSTSRNRGRGRDRGRSRDRGRDRGSKSNRESRRSNNRSRRG